MTKARQGPLTEIRVIDFTHHLGGPMGAAFLGDLGADVIKIEPPEGDSWRDINPINAPGQLSPKSLTVNRNKRSLVLDLRQPAAKEIAHELIRGADVVIHSFGPGVVQKLGIDYETLSILNPRLVYCELTAFGATGPYAGRRAFDVVVEAETGMMDYRPGIDETPRKNDIPLNDTMLGPMAAFGIMTALFEREHSGRGQKVSTSLFRMALAHRQFHMAQLQPDIETENAFPDAFYGTYRTADGFLAIGAFPERLWRRVLTTLGLDQLTTCPELADSIVAARNQVWIRQRLQERLSQAPATFWADKLQEAGVPAAVVDLDPSNLYHHPQVEHEGLLIEVDDPNLGTVKVLDTLIDFERTPGAVTTAGPGLGQHTIEILDELGLDQTLIASLLETGAAVAATPIEMRATA
jgi:crotonobetainyl-CoA:carnitine CoA-transferase CaiB-like acyl-CoA transferase